MDKDRLQELMETRATADQEVEKLRPPMTILFSDIKGSTAYAEKKGEVEYLRMITRHDSVLFPVIESEGGQVVQTIGDAILAKFDDPVNAVKAAVGMQRALAKDRRGRDEIEQIRVRIGLHYGWGLVKGNADDVFGDVVNAASRLEYQAAAERILITGALLVAARTAGFECARVGRAELKGNDEAIDLYAVAWSESASQDIIEEIQARYERKFKELTAKQEQAEEDFVNGLSQWRCERRNLTVQIEELEDSLERAHETARQQFSEDLQSELKLQVEDAIRARQQVESDFTATLEKFEIERNSLKAQIGDVQAEVVDAMERANNPNRMALPVREQVESRIAEMKQQLQSQWDAERRLLGAEIERLRKGPAPAVTEERKDAARRALLQKLGKLPAGSQAATAKSANQWEREVQDVKVQGETERGQLDLKVKNLELALQHAEDDMRAEILREVRAEYERRLAEASHHRQRLEQDILRVNGELEGERERWRSRIEQLELAVPEAQDAARRQALAEVQGQFDSKIEEANRLRSRMERRQQHLSEDFQAEQSRAQRQIASLEARLKETKEELFRVQKTSGRSLLSE